MLELPIVPQPPVYAKRMAGFLYSAKPNWVRLAPTSHKGKTRSQKMGLSYERKVQRMLEKLFPHTLSNLVFEFSNQNQFGLAIPDVVVYDFESRSICVVEVKLSHTPDAWYQLTKLYGPVVAKAFPGWKIRLLEITKSFDPSVGLPGPGVWVEDLKEWLKDSGGTNSFGVYMWRA